MWYPSKVRTDQLDKELSELVEGSPPATGECESFLVRLSEYIRFLAHRTDVPASVFRDWIWIGSQYRIHSDLDDRASRLAGGYLAQFERLVKGFTEDSGSFVEALHWVTDSGVTSLLNELGQHRWNEFLSEDEHHSVDAWLRVHRTSAPSLNDAELAALGEHISLFRDVTSETYHPGIAEIVSHLTDYARNTRPGRDAAIACLRYVLEPHDVVPDTLGYFGLVDDIYAIEQTGREIECRETWEPLLDQYREKWPFLDRIVFEEPSRDTRLPTYLQLLAGTALALERKPDLSVGFFAQWNERFPNPPSHLRRWMDDLLNVGLPK